MRMWKKETKRKRGGRDRALHVECLEDRKLLATTTEAFTGPSLTSLIQQANAGEDTYVWTGILVKGADVPGNDQLSARISRRHFEIRRVGADYCVTDLSRAGTLLNGQPLPSTAPHPSGGRIRPRDSSVTAHAVTTTPTALPRTVRP